MIDLMKIGPDDFKHVDGRNYVSTLLISNLLNIDFDVEQDYVNGYELMDLAARTSYTSPEKMNTLLDLLKMAEIIQPEIRNTYFLTAAVSETIMRNWHSTLPVETDVHKWFKKDYKKLLGPDFEIAKRKADKKNIPDAWLLKDKRQFWPVEMKLRAFDVKALSQLTRYMEFYGCEHGVAVGSDLSCDLPRAVKFVMHDLFISRK